MRREPGEGRNCVLLVLLSLLLSTGPGKERETNNRGSRIETHKGPPAAPSQLQLADGQIPLQVVPDLTGAYVEGLPPLQSVSVSDLLLTGSAEPGPDPENSQSHE